MKTKKHKYPIVEVVWLDTVSKGGWHDPNSAPNNLEHHTVGYLKDLAPDRVAVLQSYGDYSEGERMEIPKSCVQKVIILRK